MTVGLAENVNKKLNQISDTKQKISNTSFADRQKDIIQIVIYKIDNENPNIIFKPKKFLFEISRFCAVGNSTIKNSSNPYEAIGTIDYSSGFDGLGQVEYKTTRSSKEKLAFQDESYKFLSTAQKNEIYDNTVTSFLLEKYLNVMTGFSISEETFKFKNEKVLYNKQLIHDIINKQIASIVNRKTAIDKKLVKTGILFNEEPAETINTTASTTVNAVDLLLHQDSKSVINSLVSVQDITSLTTTLADFESIKNNLIMPKKFDRVFNVIFEPTDFYIDKAATEQTEIGKQALSNLLLSKDIESVIISNNTEFKLSEKRSQNEIIFDKYFVAIETIE